MTKILKNRKGMTLVELLVGMMLFAIVTTVVASIFVPILRVYVRANELAECNTLLDTVANQIVRDISNATIPPTLGTGNRIAITIDDSGELTYTIDDSNGILLKNGISVLSKTYYKGKSVNFFCNPITSVSGTAYMLTVVILSDKNGEMIRRDYAVRPLALNPY